MNNWINKSKSDKREEALEMLKKAKELEEARNKAKNLKPTINEKS